MKTALLLTSLTLAACSNPNAARVAYPPAAPDEPATTTAVDSAPAAAPPMVDSARAAASLSAPSPATTSVRSYRASAPPAPMAERARPPRPEERPGLGTLWGETIYSAAHETSFYRSAAPPSLATLYYNDRAGIAAMAEHAQRAEAASYDPPVIMQDGVSVALVDEAGGTLPAFSLGGRIYVAGEAGRRYTIVARNQTGGRFEVVASVDGLDVLDGQPASVDKRGYLLEPYGELKIDGFRRNHSQVAAFRFGAVASSYAARTSGDRNVGVIGVAIFSERGAPAISDAEIERRESAEPFDSRFARPPGE